MCFLFPQTLYVVQMAFPTFSTNFADFLWKSNQNLCLSHYFVRRIAIALPNDPFLQFDDIAFC